MTETPWYWGVVVRLDPVDELLARIHAAGAPTGVRPQRPGTGHVTLLYAPLRAEAASAQLAACAREATEATRDFTITLGGLGEFRTTSRTVAWLGVEGGGEDLQLLRGDLCCFDEDVLPYTWRPHCTLAYGDDPAAYERFRERLAAEVEGCRIEVRVDELWIAGFPQGAHPADDLTYRERLPLRG